MQLNPSEISELLKKRIEGLGVSADLRTQGTVVSLSDGIARIHGLSDVMQGEMLEFPGEVYGLALNLERDSVGAVILGEYEGISEGDTVKTTGRILSVPVGEELIGRVVNALGQPIDGKGPINAKAFDVVEKVAPGVIDRKSVSQPVQTGLKSIDSMVPIGRGQRELQDCRCDRHDHQSERQRSDLRVRSYRSEGLYDCECRSQARRARCNGLHHCCCCDGFRVCSHAVPRSVCWRYDGRILPRSWSRFFDRV